MRKHDKYPRCGDLWYDPQGYYYLIVTAYPDLARDILIVSYGAEDLLDQKEAPPTEVVRFLTFREAQCLLGPEEALPPWADEHGFYQPPETQTHLTAVEIVNWIRHILPMVDKLWTRDEDTIVPFAALEG